MVGDGQTVEKRSIRVARLSTMISTAIEYRTSRCRYSGHPNWLWRGGRNHARSERYICPIRALVLHFPTHPA